MKIDKALAIAATCAAMVTAQLSNHSSETQAADAVATAADAGLSDLDYCTILYSAKLQSDLKLSGAQLEKVGELKDRLKAMLENAADPSAVHGPANGRGRGRTLAKRGGTALSFVAPDIKKLLKPEQDQKVKKLYADGTLRPIEVVGAEVHGKTPTLNYVAIGRVGVICHYDEPSEKRGVGSNTPEMGSVHGRGVDGSFYRDTHPTAPPRQAGDSAAEAPKPQPDKTVGKEKTTSGPRTNKGPLTEERLTEIVADLNSGDNKRIGDATMQLTRTKPAEPNRTVAQALEKLLLEGDNAIVRANAAWALRIWGTHESLPALKTASGDSNRLIQTRAKKAIEAIEASSSKSE